MDLNEVFSNCIKERLNYEGVSLEFSKKTVDEINKYHFINNISEYIEKDELRTYLHCTYMNHDLMLNVLMDMLKSGEAKITFTDKASEENIRYLEKLAKK